MLSYRSSITEKAEKENPCIAHSAARPSRKVQNSAPIAARSYQNIRLRRIPRNQRRTPSSQSSKRLRRPLLSRNSSQRLKHRQRRHNLHSQQHNRHSLSSRQLRRPKHLNPLSRKRHRSRCRQRRTQLLSSSRRNSSRNPFLTPSLHSRPRKLLSSPCRRCSQHSSMLPA
ncbi:hypothetical protein GSD1FS_1956 [Bifidobacterium sp. GSD1FS]|uniref:Uncharacterized protein n=1 Tax=Bifidobacterium canis TaxID=2610880 RepID=A0A7K1J7D5_9BIFI|nr:hypothetical protein [Bifidobacterium canis]